MAVSRTVTLPSGDTVPALGQGTWHMGENPAKRQDELAAVRRGLDLGMTLIDTAEMYGSGAAEELVGEAIRGRRDEAFLVSKVLPLHADARGAVRACQASLRRLGTEHIDLFQLHTPDRITPMEETLDALADLVRSGKVRYIGCSNYSAWHLVKALSTSERRGFERYVSLQAYYSLVGRELEHELLPASQDQGVGVLVWSPLAAGFLTGKQRRGEAPPAGSRRETTGDTGTMDAEQGFDVVDVLDGIAREHGVSIAQVAINWLLRRPGVTSVIIGARTPEQLQDNLDAASWELTAEEVARLDEVSARALPYPYWHQLKMNRPRLRYTLADSGAPLS